MTYIQVLAMIGMVPCLGVALWALWKVARG